MRRRGRERGVDVDQCRQHGVHALDPRVGEMNFGSCKQDRAAANQVPSQADPRAPGDERISVG